jgi:hypothetical protein
MTLSPITASDNSLVNANKDSRSLDQLLRNASEKGNKNNSTQTNNSSNTASSLKYTAEYYSRDSLSINYSNKDGDVVTLNLDSVQYQKTELTASGASDAESWQKIVDQIKKDFMEQTGKMIKSFLKGINGGNDDNSDSSNSTNVQATTETGKSSGIQGLPEYWNADNTSQRIVDFAMSFKGLSGSGNDEFFAMMKSAIEEGFKQAKDMLRNLPDEVSGLMKDTYDLTMKKLDDLQKQYSSDNADSSVTQNAASIFEQQAIAA